MKIQWNTFAGGTGAWNPAHNSYSAMVPGGKLMIEPPARRGAQWKVIYAAQGEPWPRDGSSGLWRVIGWQPTATKAKAMAADWYETFVKPLGPMTVDAQGVVKQNPLVRVRVKAPPQRPAGNTDAPSARLVKRRKATNKKSTPRGFYANPAPLNLLGIKINAGNDRNGNPRQGWVVIQIIDHADARMVGFVDQGYGGERALKKAYGDIPAVGVFNVGAAEYAQLKKQGPVMIETGAYLGSA